MDDQQSEENEKQFVTPAASFQAKKIFRDERKDNINFGYRIITINKNEVSSEVIMFKPMNNN